MSGQSMRVFSIATVHSHSVTENWCNYHILSSIPPVCIVCDLKNVLFIYTRPNLSYDKKKWNVAHEKKRERLASRLNETSFFGWKRNVNRHLGIHLKCTIRIAFVKLISVICFFVHIFCHFWSQTLSLFAFVQCNFNPINVLTFEKWIFAWRDHFIVQKKNYYILLNR